MQIFRNQKQEYFNKKTPESFNMTEFHTGSYAIEGKMLLH